MSIQKNERGLNLAKCLVIMIASLTAITFLYGIQLTVLMYSTSSINAKYNIFNTTKNRPSDKHKDEHFQHELSIRRSNLKDVSFSYKYSTINLDVILFSPKFETIFSSKSEIFENHNYSHNITKNRITNNYEHDIIDSISFIPDTPALSLQGPPKAGTRTFMNTFSKFSDVIQYGAEHDHWVGSNKYKCHIKTDIPVNDWKIFLNSYFFHFNIDVSVNNTNKNNGNINSNSTYLTYLLNNFMDDSMKCSKGKFYEAWNYYTLEKRYRWTNIMLYENKQCIAITHEKWTSQSTNLNKKKNNIILINNGSLKLLFNTDNTSTIAKNNFTSDEMELISNLIYKHKFCYFAEKGPTYSRSIWTPIVWSHLYPKIHILLIIRNPIMHVQSCLWALSPSIYNRYRQSNTSDAIKVNSIAIKLFYENKSFINLSMLINQTINKEWSDYNAYGSNSNRYLFMKNSSYTKFLYQYFYNRYIYPRDINPRGPRGNIFIWAPFVLPHILMSLFSYEEVASRLYGDNILFKLNNNYNTIESDYQINYEIYNYRLIQFEWLYGNIPLAMKYVKCWTMNVVNIKNCEIKIQDKSIFNNIEHLNSASNNPVYDEYYVKEMNKLWGPHSLAIKNLLTVDRPYLLIGDWLDWKFMHLTT